MRKFKIPSIPPTTNKCIRFPNDVIEDVEKAIEGKKLYLYRFRDRSGQSCIGKFRR